ncbi:MAG: TonB-dependent receptor [Pseudomonadota bacterium]
MNAVNARKVRKFFLGSTAAVSTLAGSLAAQEFAVEEPSGDDALVLASGQLDEITVYATRNPLPAFDYPGAVSVIDRDIIDDFNPSTIFDIFDSIPGAQIGGGPRRTGQVPAIRGIGGEGVLVLFDGARQSFLSGHDGRFFIDPDLVQAVEVVRGPTSALYGSGALGGTIALRTVTASDFLQEGETAAVKAAVGFQGVNDEFRLSGTGVWRSDDNVTDIVANFTRRQSGDIELGSGDTLPADDEIMSSLIKATVRPSDDLTLALSWIRYGGNSVDPNNPQGDNLAGPGNDLVNRDIDSNTLQGRLSFNPQSNDLIDFNFTGYYTRNDVTEDVIGSMRVVTRDVETFGFVADNRSRFSFGDIGGLTLTYGGEYYEDQQIGEDNTTADGTRGGVPDATGRFYGAFVQAELAFNQPLGAPGVLTFIPGVRWDRFENEATGEASTDDDAVSPKIGVSYKPVEQFIIFGNWAEAFRAPSFNELYADGVHFQIPNLSVPGPFGPFGPPAFVTNFFVPNGDLLPEESQTWEVGAGVDFAGIFFGGDTFIAKGSYYSSDVDNLIDLNVLIPFTCFLTPDMLPPFAPPCGSGEAFGNTSQNVNVTNADLTGVEIEFQYDSPYAYLRGNFNAIDGTNEDTGEFVGSLAPTTVFLDGGVKFADGDLRLGSRVIIAGDFDEVNDPTLERDGFTVADVYAVWQPSAGALEGLRVDVGVDNVTDADFEVVAAGVSQPGRNVKATVSWTQAF